MTWISRFDGYLVVATIQAFLITQLWLGIALRLHKRVSTVYCMSCLHWPERFISQTRFVLSG